VVWVRPVERNIALLEKELRDPKYGEYHIFFSNHTGDWREDWRDPRCESTDDYIERLAIADEFELVRKIGECYSDFVAVSPELFSLNIQRSGGRDEWHGDSWRSDIVGGVMSALLALRLRPVVRYASRSPHARSLAESIERAIRGGEDDTAWVRQHWERFEEQALKSFEQESRRTRGGAGRLIRAVDRRPCRRPDNSVRTNGVSTALWTHFRRPCCAGCCTRGRTKL
jgi:hypothetical protein